MPKFLAGCHYSEEEISRHFKDNIGFWPVQINGNNFATGQYLKNPVQGVKGWILASWARKSPVSYRVFPANGRAARALRPIVAAPELALKNASLLVGVHDWPSHQHVWAGL